MFDPNSVRPLPLDDSWAALQIVLRHRFAVGHSISERRMLRTMDTIVFLTFSLWGAQYTSQNLILGEALTH